MAGELTSHVADGRYLLQCCYHIYTVSTKKRPPKHV